MSIEHGVELEPIESPAVEPSQVAQSAAILSIGNVLSRVLGLARETIIADLFGASSLVSVLRVALTVPTMIYDLLVGGLISAALVPMFSDYANRRDELWRLASLVLSMTIAALALVVVVLEIFAPQLVWALGSGYTESLQQTAVELVRLILPATTFLGASGISAAILYALKRFRYPAFTAALFNLSIVICALVLSRWFGIASVVIGVLIGALGQLALQIPGLRDFRFRLSFDWRNPALQKILTLYAPVVAGLVVSNLQIALDRNLASQTGAQSVAWMQNATTLIQFPDGLVITAISLAVLPTLAQATEKFQSTLAMGLRWALLLILPATFLLGVLAQPVVALLFEHGAFTAIDTTQTANALLVYLLGLPFIAIDRPLVFAFYARKDTLRPALVGVAGVAVYTIVALALYRPYGMPGLVLANSAQWVGHALMMVWLLQTRLGGLPGQGVLRASAKILAGALIAAGAAYLALSQFDTYVLSSGFPEKFARVALPLLVAMPVYFVAIKALQVSEADELVAVLRRRLHV